LETEQKKTSVAVVSIKKAEPFGKKSGLKISMGATWLLSKLSLFSVLLGSNIKMKLKIRGNLERIDNVRM
jgi:hypothetical protein